MCTYMLPFYDLASFLSSVACFVLLIPRFKPWSEDLRGSFLYILCRELLQSMALCLCGIVWARVKSGAVLENLFVFDPDPDLRRAGACRERGTADADSADRWAHDGQKVAESLRTLDIGIDIYT